MEVPSMPRLLSWRFGRFAVALAAVVALVPVPARAQTAPRLEPESVLTPSDPTRDGAVKGALVGAGAMAGVLTIGYARCDAGCEAPAEDPMLASGLAAAPSSAG
jgi:hypothetical protein